MAKRVPLDIETYNKKRDFTSLDAGERTPAKKAPAKKVAAKKAPAKKAAPARKRA